MAFHNFFCFLIVIVVTFICSSHAYTFEVGGKDGWTTHPSENYNSWSGRLRFLINDTLHFKYDGGVDSVLIVNKGDYDGCNVNSPIMKLDGGDSMFKFDRSGPFYFISGNKANCDQGQKLIVVVLALRNHSPPPSTVTPPSPSTNPPPSAVSPTLPPSPPTESPGGNTPGGGGGGSASSPSTGGSASSPGSSGGSASSPGGGGGSAFSPANSPYGGNASSPSGGGGASSPSASSPEGEGGASSPGDGGASSPRGGGGGAGAQSPNGNNPASDVNTPSPPSSATPLLCRTIIASLVTMCVALWLSIQ